VGITILEIYPAVADLSV